MALLGENVKANVACLTCAVVAAGVEYTPTVNGFWKPAAKKVDNFDDGDDNDDEDDDGDEDELKRLFLLVSARGP